MNNFRDVSRLQFNQINMQVRAGTQVIPLNGNFHVMSERFFCTSGLRLEASFFFQVYESLSSLQRPKATAYCLPELTGEVGLVFLSRVHLALLRPGAVTLVGNVSRAFLIADLVDSKFTLKDKTLPAHQWLNCLAFSGGLFC